MLTIMRTSTRLRLEAELATMRERTRMQAEMNRELGVQLRAVRRERFDMLELVLKMKQQGYQDGPPADEIWGRYSIAEEEAKQLEEVGKPRREERPSDDALDLAAFEAELDRELSVLDGD